MKTRLPVVRLLNPQLDDIVDRGRELRIMQRHGWLQCNVGGGIVAQSDPSSEYEETLTKAAGMLKALVPHKEKAI